MFSGRGVLRAATFRPARPTVGNAAKTASARAKPVTSARAFMTPTGCTARPSAESGPVPSSELVLAVGLDGHVRGGVGDASQAEAIAHLVVVQEGLVRLVDGAGQHLARAARAGARPARVRQLDSLLFRLVQDVHVLGALEARCPSHSAWTGRS